jgi:probable phosphomutase (TIGR03848 family)
MPTIILIRHGDNDLVKTRLVGRLPGVHLNEHGRKQAIRVAEALADISISAIYSSPMERTLETAAPLVKSKGLQVEVRNGLNEVDYGNWQGKTYKQLRLTKYWQEVQQKPALIHFPGGESLVTAQKRVCEELDKIRLSCKPHDVVACVTHGDVIRLAVLYYLGAPLDSLHRINIDLSSMTIIRWEDDKPCLLYINQMIPFNWQPRPVDNSSG